MTKSLFRGKSTRTKIFTAITVVAILLVIVLNLLLSYFGDQGQIFIDMTPEGFYTLTDKMKESCKDILTSDTVKDKEVKIIFCSDPDALEASYAMRPTYFMALQLRNRFDNVTVETVNVKVNPAALTTIYSTTSHRDISPTDVIVDYDGRYRITDATTFWTENSFSYNGEYRMVSILASLTAQNSPAAYFTTNHGETYYDPANTGSDMSKSMAVAAELLEERGLTVKTLDLSAVTAIPEDCALLIINAPTEDLKSDPSKYNQFDYVSETEMIDRYLRSKMGAVIINKGYDTGYLDNLETFTAEWGISFGNCYVRDEDSYLHHDGELVGVYDKESFGGAYYGDYAGLSTAPKMVFTNSGYLYSTIHPEEKEQESGGYNTHITYADFISTSAAAKGYLDSEGENPTTEAGKKSLAAASVRTYLDGDTAETSYSYLFCTNTADFFSNELLGNKSYANYGIMASVISSISRIDRYASMSLGGLSHNSPSYGGKQTHTTTLTEKPVEVYSPDAKELLCVNEAFLTWHKVLFTVLVSVLPLAIAVLGIVVRVKRKNL